MSYVDKNLMDGEQVFYRAYRHWTIFDGPLLVLLAGVLVFSGVRLWAPPEWAPDSISIAALALGAVVALFMAIPAFIERVTSEFAVTNKRVIIKVGLISRRTLEMNLSKIESVNVNQGMLGRMLGYGTIVVVGTGGTKEPFAAISDPLTFRKKFQEVQA